MMKNVHIAILLLFVTSACVSRALASEAKSPVILSPGEAEVAAAAGAVILPDEHVAGLELSLRIGLLPALEIAGPLGLSIRLIHAPDAGTLYFSFGIADLYFPGDDELLYRPTAMLAGAYFIGREATLRGAVDFSGAERGMNRGDHPVWVRGSAAVLMDFGNVATLAIGIAYQRVVAEGAHPPHLDRTGWAYDARISFGSVQTQPFSELPMLSIHMHPGIDFIAICKFDINTDTGNNSFRLLLGFSLTK